MGKVTAAVLSTLVVTSVFAGLGIVTAQPAQTAAQPSKSINKCTDITQSGTYQISSDIAGQRINCITIGADNVILEGNFHTIDGGGIESPGILITGKNVIVKDVTVTGWEIGIFIRGTSDVTVSNTNVRDNSYRGIEVGDGTEEVTIKDNTVVGHDDSGIHFQSSELGSGVSRNHTVLNNTVRNNQEGIHLLGSPDNNISHNSATNNWIGIDLSDVDDDDGIETTNNIISNNTVRNNTLEGIGLTNAPNNTIKDNTARNEGEGISLADSPNNKIVSNNGTNNSAFIQLIRSSNNTIKNNTARKGGVGIWLQISNNRNNIIVNNTVRNGSIGVSLANSLQNTISNNTLRNGSNTGIVFYNSSKNIISNNNANSNSGNGIGLQNSSDNTILNNNVISNSGDGILLADSSDNTISNNNAISNSVDGILLADSSDNTILSNAANYNSRDGIALYRSIGYTISNNNVKNNSRNGIALVRNSTYNTVSHNSAMNNSRTGLYLDESSNNTILNNTARNNAKWSYQSTNNSTTNAVIDLTINPMISFESKDIALRPVSSPPTDPVGKTNIGQYLFVTNTSTDSWMFMNLTYSDSDVSKVDESTVRMWKHNGSSWSKVSGVNRVNEQENNVLANVTNFSIFAPLGDASQSITLPGAVGPAQSTDADPLLEDVDGDGSANVFDAIALYNNRNAPVVQNNPQFFDFDGDGTINIFDAIELFNKIS